jgi:putative transcriptional regulator
MSRHPAPDELLLDYAAGVLPEGPALAVSLHVALDPMAQRTVARLTAMGGALLESEGEGAGESGPDRGDAALEGVLARLDRLAVGANPTRRRTGRTGLATGVGAVPGGRWKRVRRLRPTEIGRGDTHRVASPPAARLPAGASPRRQRVHGGAAGRLQFSARNYGVGDFGGGPAGARAIADPGEPYIALIVVESRSCCRQPGTAQPVMRWSWM